MLHIRKIIKSVFAIVKHHVDQHNFGDRHPCSTNFIQTAQQYKRPSVIVEKYEYQQGFHLVTSSPWPFYTAIVLWGLTIGTVLFFHGYSCGGFLMSFSFFSLLMIMAFWWRDVVLEATYEGNHTACVQQSLRFGMFLFIISEVMFFFGFFWTFFHSSLSPAIEIGGIWPPKGITPFSPYEIPLLNTLILVTSGACITWAHRGFFLKSHLLEYFPILGRGYFKNDELFGYHSKGRIEVFCGLGATIFLGLLFTCIQAYEYVTAPFTISDGIYGSIFYIATGFHGLHVIVGTIFLCVALFRHYFYHFTKTHHFGFEAAAWYWHFVDVVWLFLYIAIYWWGC